MKRILIAAVLAATAATAHAGETASCADFGDLAETIMTNRQQNVPLSAMMDVVKDNQAISKLVIIAYEQPRYSSESYQASAVADFRNAVETDCFKRQ